MAKNIFDRFDSLPAPRNVAAFGTVKIFDEAVNQTGKLTIFHIVSTGAASYQTVRKHIVAGILPAEKQVVGGKLVWLIEPDAARVYLNNLAGLLEKAVRHKKNKPARVTAPDGFVTLTEAAERCGVSHWTLREHLERTGVKASVGRHAAKMIAAGDVIKLKTYFQDMVRPKSRTTAPHAPAKGRVAGGLYFDTFEQLWAMMLAQPETDFGEIEHVTGATRKTVRRWSARERRPDSQYHGAIVALFRERYQCRLSDTLQAAAAEHRRLYMRDYMREIRKSQKGSE